MKKTVITLQNVRKKMISEKHTNIGIVTLQDSPNCGARLQAFALAQVITDMGYSVFFLKSAARNIFKIKIKHIVKSVLKRNLSAVIFHFKQLFSYSFSNIKFHTKNFSEFQEMKKIVLGSDEIWNISKKIISRYPFLWGKDLRPPKISYAPSINTSSLLDFEKSETLEDFKNIEAISVRDNHSKEVLEKYTNRNVDVVCDPTMLLPIEEWQKKEKNCPETKDFILMYSYCNQLSANDIKKIKDFSEQTKLPIISALDYFPFAEQNIPLNPELFLGYVHKAKYVITSTFHGSCFSLIYKKFACIAHKNQKITELLKNFKIEELNAVDSKSLCDVISLNTIQQIEERKKIMETYRLDSYNWLKNHL